MGSQQLLIILLGTIVVGVAVLVGIEMFSSNASEANRDSLSSDLTNLASRAQQYYRKPTVFSGGGRTFNRWALPPAAQSNANGTFTSTTGGQSITITAVGVQPGIDETSPVQLQMLVTPDSTVVTIVN